MINLADPIERSKLSYQIKADIDAACVEHFKDDPRKHLGASIIGHDCQAYLWNTFRWLKQEQFDGRMHRLFNRGHLEEPRIIKWLQLIGFEVYEINKDTGKQFQITGSNGHFGGSLDSILVHKEYGTFLGEFKTHAQKKYDELVKQGVKKAQPKHYRQMNSYGKVYNIHYGLYFPVCKNDDNIQPEIVELDFANADDLFRKADGIINSKKQSPKIAQTITFKECTYCNFKEICHQGEEPEKNCRSCEHAFPTENATWTCGLVNQVIPDEIIKIGCQSWRRII